MAPRNARSAGSKRYYDWKGERFWSVTTILSGGVPKPAENEAWRHLQEASA